MTDLVALIADLTAVLRSCPAIVDELEGNAYAIAAYQDMATDEQNSLQRMTYMQPNGTVMIAWTGSGITEGEMTGWSHSVDVLVRAIRRKSPLSLLHAIIDGTPEGSEQRWRYGCINDDVLPVSIGSIVRLTDEEHIDAYVIHMEFKEKGDYDGLSG